MPTDSRSASAARVRAEGLITLTQAGALFAPPVTVRTLLRWTLHGVDGHRLDSCRVRGYRYTSIAAVRRFQARTGKAGA